MRFGRHPTRPWLVPLLVAIVAGCGGAVPSSTTPATQTPTQSQTAPTGVAVATATDSTGAIALRFVDLTDGGTVAGKQDANGRPLVVVKIEATVKAPLLVSLSADGLPAVDVGGRSLEAMNPDGIVPFVAEIQWSPPRGGGTYALMATAYDDEKNLVQTTIHITVTGVPSFTLPPAPTPAQAKAKVTKLIQDTYHVGIPAPSLQRFDFPTNPTRNRWIGAAYYKGMRYYVSIFDNGTVEWSNGPYSDPAHRSSASGYNYCRPAGTFRVLVAFVDYGNTGTVKADALAKVPVVVAWLNGMYTSFATGQGFASAPMRIEADAVYIDSPPARGELLSSLQIRTLTGKDSLAYDFVMQIDLDRNATYSAQYTSKDKGGLEPGGGLALEACGDGKFGGVNIWSSVTDASSVQGGLVMDFDHELSHMFGMMDDWPFALGSPGPAGTTVDDWIPYTMFGWTDTDGDGVPEILDGTPYGTAGPKP